MVLWYTNRQLQLMHRKITFSLIRSKFKLSQASLEHMKASGLMIKGTDMDTKYLQTEMFIKEALIKANQMEEGFIIGQMVKFMRGNGKWELRRVQAFGKV